MPFVLWHHLPCFLLGSCRCYITLVIKETWCSLIKYRENIFPNEAFLKMFYLKRHSSSKEANEYRMSKQRNKTSNRESIQGEQQILCLETDLLQESAASQRITASPKSRLTTECVSNPKKEQVKEKVCFQNIHQIQTITSLRQSHVM